MELLLKPRGGSPSDQGRAQETEDHAGTEPASKHASIASSILWKRSWCVSAWLTQPGNSTTSPHHPPSSASRTKMWNVSPSSVFLVFSFVRVVIWTSSPLKPHTSSRNCSSVTPAVLMRDFRRPSFRMPCGIAKFQRPKLTTLWLPLPLRSTPPSRTKARTACSCLMFFSDAMVRHRAACCALYAHGTTCQYYIETNLLPRDFRATVSEESVLCLPRPRRELTLGIQ